MAVAIASLLTVIISDSFMEDAYKDKQSEKRAMRIWKNKIDWIAAKGGMALINSHPDYMNFNKKKNGPDEYPAKKYKEFLIYIKSKYEGQYWHLLPKEIAQFWMSHVVKE